MILMLLSKNIAKIWARSIQRGTRSLDDVQPPEFRNDVQQAFLEIFGYPCPVPKHDDEEKPQE